VCQGRTAKMRRAQEAGVRNILNLVLRHLYHGPIDRY
jgi:hypothetical protein